MFVKMSIGSKILERRNLAKLSREALAGIVKMTSVSIENYESDKRSPKANDLKKIAKALNTTVAYILEETNDPSLNALQKTSLSEEEIDKLGFRARSNEGDLAPKDDLERMHKALLLEYEAAKRLREFEEKKYKGRDNPKSSK